MDLKAQFEDDHNSMQSPKDQSPVESARNPEPEHRGSIWKHPYLIYAVLNLLLFLVLGLIGWMAYENDWIPKR